MNPRHWKPHALPGLLAACTLFAAPAEHAMADRPVMGSTRTSISQSAGLDRGAIEVTGLQADVDTGADSNWHAAAVSGTSAAPAAKAPVIGSVARSLPPACVPVQASGVVYQQCGGTYYQPQYVGMAVQYLVVSPPL